MPLDLRFPSVERALISFLALLPLFAVRASEPPLNFRRAEIATLLPKVREKIRAWEADGALVDLRCEPNADGSVDLAAQGGNLLCFAYSPSKHSGATIQFSAVGEPTLTPSPGPTSPARFAIPTNIIALKDAMKIAMKEGLNGPPSRVELYGSGDDVNLRQFCWIVMGETRPYCVDAMFGFSTPYKDFNNGRERFHSIPFTANLGINYYSTRYMRDDVQMYWYRAHVVYLDGVDEAIKVEVPWQLISKAEMKKHSHLEKGEEVFDTGSKTYPLGDFTPLTAEAKKRLLANEDAIEINCAPGVVLLGGDQKLSDAIRKRVKDQLNSAKPR